MLNDLATFTRLSLLFQVLPIGMLIGGSSMAMKTSALSAFLVVMVLVVVALTAWAISVVVWTRTAARRFHHDVERGSAEIVEQGLAADIVPARMVRSRVGRHLRPWALGDVAPPTGTWSVTFTALPPGEPARRVGALVPLPLPKGAPVLLALHPSLREVGVIDLRATREQVSLAGQDPRWHSEPLPTDRTVVGGWLALLGSAVLGLLAGGVLAAALMWVLT
ncbi:hypothetical protein ASG90_06565 [Nocardioides sp. Soil797]|nr:hypothetical protein ASG90_06565 [Nocardioides sp. Soil797]